MPFALGTDTAGSGRVPAALNGDRRPQAHARAASAPRGVVPACRSLDCVSVFAARAADAAAVLAVADAHDPLDPFARPQRLRQQAPERGLRGLRVGVLDAGVVAGLDPRAARTCARQLAALEAHGARLRTPDLDPLWEAGALLYDGPWVAERWAALGQFVEEHEDAVHPVTLAVLSSAGRWTAADAFRAQHRLAELRLATSALWREVDVLALPTVGVVPSLDDDAVDPVGVSRALGRFTNFANLLDLCAVVPAAQAQGGGVPAGVTLFAPALSDRLLLRVTAALEEASGA